MDRFRLHLRPDEMTPEERLERVIELLATAAIRRARELAQEDAGREHSLDGSPTTKVESFHG